MKISSTLNTGAWITLLYLAALSCNKNSPVSPAIGLQEKTAAEYTISSVMDYQVSPETGNLDIIFYESQRMYTFPAASPDFQVTLQKIKESKENYSPVRTTFGEG